MSRFDYRLKRLEESFLPAATASAIIDALSKDDLSLMILNGHRRQLKQARGEGDKDLAADLKLIVERDAKELPEPSSRAEKLKRTARINRLLDEIMAAKCDYTDGDALIKQWREHIRKEAEEIRWQKRYPDLLAKLKNGGILEFEDRDAVPVAMARLVPDYPNGQYLAAEMISPFAVSKTEYIRAGNPESEDIVMRRWRAHCKWAESMKAEIAAGRAKPPEPPAPKKAPEPEPAPPPRAAPPKPEPLPENVIKFHQSMTVSEYQQMLRRNNLPITKA
jgi:hypothetical protein